MGSTFLYRLNFYSLSFPAQWHLNQAFCVSSFLYLFSLSRSGMVVPCCNPHDTYILSVFYYSVLLSSIQIFLFQSSLLYPTCHVSSPWQIMLPYPDIPCVACPVLPCIIPTCSAFLSLRYLSYDLYFPSLSEFYLYQKFALPWSARPSWRVSNLSYCIV